MPSTVTHAFFAKDVYDILPSNISNKLNVNRCKEFGQGTDSLMFLLTNKKIRRLHYYSHDNNTRDFFINLLNYIKNNSIDDIDTYSFLVGFICHYVLDYTIHPFVIYKTGYFIKNNPNTYKYNCIHHFMETFIDNDIVRRRLKINPYKFNISKYCFNNKLFSKELDNTIDNVFYDTYKIKDMGKYYFKSLKKQSRFIKLFRRDQYGIKKFLYKLMDTITPRKLYRFESISYHYPLEDRHNFLNSTNSTWRNPTTYNISSTESFIDLYIKALKDAKELVCASFNYLNGDNVELDKVFTNLSYYTGLDCDDKKVLKYFEF